MVALVRTDLGYSALYQLIYADIAYYLFSFILPLLLLAVFNTQLIITYRGVGVHSLQQAPGM